MRHKFEKETLKEKSPEETLLLEKSGTGDAEVSPTTKGLRQRLVCPVEEEVVT